MQDLFTSVFDMLLSIPWSPSDAKFSSAFSLAPQLIPLQLSLSVHFLDPCPRNWVTPLLT